MLINEKVKRPRVPDFVVRFPRLDASMNPVLVEVQSSRVTPNRARDQLANALQHAKAHLGLLVTLDLVPYERKRVGPVQVITQISIEDLENHPAHLAKLLSEARNFLVHG
jgi:hypothetical protein